MHVLGILGQCKWGQQKWKASHYCRSRWIGKFESLTEIMMKPMTCSKLAEYMMSGNVDPAWKISIHYSGRPPTLMR